MYSASSAFRQAVANGNPQMALLLFPDCVFSNRDLDMEKGIEFNDYFNTEDDLTVGLTPSNEISFSILNADRLLNDYEFGEFTATIGVMTARSGYQQSGNARVMIGNDLYVGNTNYPYITRNGNIMDYQPNFAVRSFLVNGNRMYAFGDNGKYKVYNTANGISVNETVNAYMLNKAANQWRGWGINWQAGTKTLKTWHNGSAETYEFAPLGNFTADRPDVPDVLWVDFTCHDAMTKFDIDMPTAQQLGITYPVTLGVLLSKMCQYVGVPLRSAAFINSGVTLDKAPQEFENASMRTVLGWIAEAAASIARIDRDGYLKMDWVRETDQSLDETGYTEFSPKWYETQPVGKIYNRSVTEGKERIYGDGTVEYLIQDNPFLREEG